MTPEKIVVASEATQQRRTAYYTGRVQGVGFRYTTRSIAQQYAVTGFAQNLDDGRVLVVVEGAPDELSRFLENVSENMSRYIRHVDVVTSPPTGEYTGFTIEHHS